MPETYIYLSIDAGLFHHNDLPLQYGWVHHNIIARLNNRIWYEPLQHEDEKKRKMNVKTPPGQDRQKVPKSFSISTGRLNYTHTRLLGSVPPNLLTLYPGDL